MPFTITFTGLEGPTGRPSRADMGAAARRALPFPTVGAPYGGLQLHGPDRPATIAHRHWCPSCDAQPGEPCRLSPRFTQDYSHEARHQVARRALWRALSREMDISTGWTVGRATS